MIAAVSSNLGIGYEGKLLYSCKKDMKHFKELTLGKTIIMGKATWDSLPIKPLPGRRNIILSHNTETTSGAEVVGSVKEALELCKNDEEVMVIGGASIYEQFLPYAQTLYLTQFITQPKADRFFPQYYDNFKKVKEEYWYLDGQPFYFRTYERTNLPLL